MFGNDKAVELMKKLGVYNYSITSISLSNRVDLVVHSLKDLPTTLPNGFTIGAVLQ